MSTMDAQKYSVSTKYSLPSIFVKSKVIAFLYYENAKAEHASCDCN